MSQGKVALVTGGAKRVGAAIVHRLAAEGYDVAFTYHASAAAAGAIEQEIFRSHGRWVVPIRADLGAPAEAVATIGRAFDGQFGRLDLLVNNASVYEPADLAAVNADVLRRAYAVHVESPLLLCQRFAPLLRAAGGHVVNMVDLLAERPWPKYLAYCASKAALWNLTLSLARELAPEVTVNAIAPGVVAWPDDYPEAEQVKYLKRVPLGRAGTPEDVAEAVMYFCGHAPYVTGQVLRLDGGRSIT